jgi:glycyl-tRNA synthetase beta chain
MSELLLELFSEEIPARMQARAAADLKRLITDGLVEAGCTFEGAQAHVTPRRLILSVLGLPSSQPDVKEERKGPRVDAPEQAINGFLKAAGVTVEQCETREDKKGTFYVAMIERAGKPTPEIIAELVPDVIRKFPWPKSMRWGSGSLRWVRPLHSILCTFDHEIVPFEVEGIASGKTTLGHRFMGNGKPLKATTYEDYETALYKQKVVVDANHRAETIRADAKNLAFAQGLEVIEDEALLAETAGLVEWPVVLMGEFDAAFLDVPPEVIITSIKSHQKCFSLREPKSGKLANKFLLVSNLIAKDGGKMITAGNERVIAARLSDAKFFWDQDRKVPLAERNKALEKITFHAKLGTQAERVERIEKLVVEIAGMIDANEDQTRAAARLCKADLVTGMVGEFPELQGLMGKYYAEAEGIDKVVASALAYHYKPQGPSDEVPSSKVAQAVALADKIDTLIKFWEIDEKPTGSKDPYALRRAALGVIRIVLEGKYSFQLADLVEPDLFNFFLDRLRVHLREQGTKHDLIDAVYALEDRDDFFLLVEKIEALETFLDTEDGKNLLQGYKRTVNILASEENKGTVVVGIVDPSLFDSDVEHELFDALESNYLDAIHVDNINDFQEVLGWLARLRAPVDAFFEAVHVNADDENVRANRLGLLARIRAATLQVADFSKIGG